MSWDSIKSDSARLLTYQDFVDAGEENREAFALEAIRRHMASESYRVAVDADLYDMQRNPTINKYVQQIFDITGSKLVDFTASNNKIACNFFHRLNTQRVMYSLGNGVSFIDTSEAGHKDTTKERLGKHFDHDMQLLAYKALTHGVSFAFWNIDRMCVFPLTEFAPLWDEQTGTLRAGIRFWRLDPTRPMQVVLYEEDGWSRFKTVQSSNGSQSERLVMTS